MTRMSLEEYRIQSMKERLEVLFDGEEEAFMKCLENLIIAICDVE